MRLPLTDLPLLALAVLLCGQAPAPTDPAGEACSPDEGPACTPSPPSPAPRDAAPAGDAPGAALTFYWGVGCPRCEEAQPFLDALAREQPGLRISRIEVRRDASGRAA